MYKLFSRQ